MENYMVFDSKMKRRLQVICFIPAVCFALCVLYYLTLIIPLAHESYIPNRIVAVTSQNYSTLLVMLATSAIITTPVFIYCLVIVARLKYLNPPVKIMWIIFLSALAPVASVFFWYFLIRHEPMYVDTYPDIA